MRRLLVPCICTLFITSTFADTRRLPGIAQTLNTTTTIEETMWSAAPATRPWVTSTTTTLLLKPHREITASGFVPEPTEKPNVKSRLPRDVQSIIESAIQWSTVNFAHVELTASSIGLPRIRPPSSSQIEGSTWAKPHLESTVGGWGSKDILTIFPTEFTAAIFPPPVTLGDVILTPEPITKIHISDEMLTPGGQTITLGNGPSATKVAVDSNGQPIIVVGTSATTFNIPIPIGDKTASRIPNGIVIDDQTVKQGGLTATLGQGSGRLTIVSINEAGETIAVVNGASSTITAPATQTLAIGEIMATAEVHDYQYAMEFTTLANGQAVTVGDTVIALSTNAAGQKVLVADRATTTLPVGGSQNMRVSATVVFGTTMYIIDGQTLGPGSPITVQGTPISITTIASNTILVIGDQTTTIFKPTPTDRFDSNKETPKVAKAPPSPANTSSRSWAERVLPSWRFIRTSVLVVATVAGCG